MRQIYMDCQKVRQNCINYPNIEDKVRQNYLLELVGYYLKIDIVLSFDMVYYLFYDDKDNN